MSWTHFLLSQFFIYISCTKWDLKNFISASVSLIFDVIMTNHNSTANFTAVEFFVSLFCSTFLQ